MMASSQIKVNPVENIRRTVLVVDDEEINRLILTNLLKTDYNIVTATDGIEALKILRSGKRIAAVLLDLKMPNMNGYEVLAAIQKDSILSAIPVIVTTSSDGDEDEIKALSLGAADFVTKPYNQQIIKYRVANTINLMESTAIINMTEHDALTGLYTREFFYTYCEELMSEHSDTSYDIIAIDVTNFKLVNDLYGRSIGDRVLRKIADSARDSVHMTGGIVCRTGGDHFLIFLPRRSDYAQFLPYLFRGVETDPDGPRIRFRFGLYEITNRGIPFSTMCDRAFIASDSAKDQYNTLFVRYDDEMRRKLMDEQALSGSLENALAENQFIVYFQPKYRLSDGKLAGAEALVRWNHPERGLIPPNLFIPLFERNGQISSLDKYVWKKTSESVRRWIDKYGKSVPVSVNISRVDVYEPLLPEVLEKIITDSGVTSENIYLEITESAYTRDPEQLIDIVKKLKEKGFTIEMDDFGSGYSSLNMLNRLPIDVLKLDLKFLENSKITMEDPGLMTYIMGIAKWMNVPVVAEGAETKEQVDLMKHLGCEYVQGYYFSKPLPPEEFEKRMVKDS